jgi:hypothetical protein
VSKDELRHLTNELNAMYSFENLPDEFFKDRYLPEPKPGRIYAVRELRKVSEEQQKFLFYNK